MQKYFVPDSGIDQDKIIFNVKEIDKVIFGDKILDSTLSDEDSRLAWNSAVDEVIVIQPTLHFGMFMQQDFLYMINPEKSKLPHTFDVK